MPPAPSVPAPAATQAPSRTAQASSHAPAGGPLSPEERERRWRAQQEAREPFPAPRVYLADAPLPLLWYDPVTGESLEIGTLFGPFTAQATFIFRPQNAPALEVPYRIDSDFGLTSVSTAVTDRMRAAGYDTTVEAYILVKDGAVRPQP